MSSLERELIMEDNKNSKWAWPKPETENPDKFVPPPHLEFDCEKTEEELDRLAKEAYLNKLQTLERKRRKKVARKATLEYQRKVAKSEKTVSGAAIGLPSYKEIRIRTWPYRAVYSIERDEEGNISRKVALTEDDISKPDRIKRDSMIEAKEIRLIKLNTFRKNNALIHGRPELVIDNPFVNLQEMQQIIARKAEIELARNEVPDKPSTDELLMDQRAFELAVGEFGDIPDPDTTIDHIRKVLERKNELEQANLELNFKS